MRNEPSNVNQGPRDRIPTPPPSTSAEDSPDVYSLPPPLPPNQAGEDRSRDIYLLILQFLLIFYHGIYCTLN